ncbi:hypothetical protein I546_4792 [Mycobacterium kansasii 732]|nr:hypothetical protein I546_4792 [Mycobacterium kansasii 732]
MRKRDLGPPHPARKSSGIGPGNAFGAVLDERTDPKLWLTTRALRRRARAV